MEDYLPSKTEIANKLQREMENLTVLQDCIQRSDLMTQNMLTILNSFENRLSKLEETINPIYQETGNLQRRHENIEKTLSALNHVIGFYHVAEDMEPIIRDGPSSGLDNYLQCMDKLQKAVQYLTVNHNGSTEMSHVISLFDAGKDAMEKEFRNSLSRHGRPVSADTLKQVLTAEDGENSVKAAQNKGKYQRTILYVSGDALRVADEISKGLIVDQTIEKVSFCAPDRNNEKGFAYICRDGTTRRWMCHGFLALKETGERLSHAVGCAFTVCLEKKQAREKEKVTVTFNENGTSFSRTGSFRQTSMTERIVDPQSAIVAEPVPVKKSENLYEVQRPRASVDMLQRQNSFRGFSKLGETSPFKRQMSLRLDELSSTADRLKQFVEENGTSNIGLQSSHAACSPITEASPMNEPADSIAQMCQQVSHGLSAMTSDDPFLVVPAVARLGLSGGGQSGPVSSAPTSQKSTPQHSVALDASASDASRSNAVASTAGQPIRQSNPWACSQAHPSTVSDADFWLHSTANFVGGTRGRGTVPPHSSVAPNSNANPGLPAQSKPPPFTGVERQFSVVQRAPHLLHIRAHSVDSSCANPNTAGRGLAHQARNNAVDYGIQAGSNCHGIRNSPAPATGTKNSNPPGFDPFDAAWAAKVAGRSTNPFHPPLESSNKSFEVKL